MTRNYRYCAIAALLGAALALANPCAAQGVSVTTYHYDNLRTGWNPNESFLTPANVSGGTFGILATMSLGKTGPQPVNALAQPLIVSHLNIPNQGFHDVLYIATETNVIYMYDATTGALLNQRTLGTPIPAFGEPSINSPVGIDSTPVIDTTRGTMYVLNAAVANASVSLVLHALDLVTLADKVTPVTVAGSHQLVNGTTVNFTASAQRQRPALLESNGTIYAGFGSYGDQHEQTSRGWLLGWNANTLVPRTANTVSNVLATSLGNCWLGGAGPCFLSSIWMSGFGPAADGSGNVYVLTGNSDPGTYDGINNFQESALKVSSDLTKILDYFTPWQVTTMDENDFDLGSGGIMLLPDLPGAFPHLAVAAGKVGVLYLLNRDNMGQHTTAAPDNVLEETPIGGCWCGASYFLNNGTAYVVGSGGNTITLFELNTTGPTPTLVRKTMSNPLATGQDPGFFTSVSSHLNQAGTAIIWAISHPQTVNGTVTLYAFNATTMAPLFSTAVGTWPLSNGNANLVPVVANGKVYLTAGNSVVILGLGAPAAATASASATVSDDTTSGDELRPAENEIFGYTLSVQPTTIMLQKRDGEIVTVDYTKAKSLDQIATPIQGRALGVIGTYDGNGVLDADVVFYAKQSPSLWLSDK